MFFFLLTHHDLLHYTVGVAATHIDDLASEVGRKSKTDRDFQFESVNNSDPFPNSSLPFFGLLFLVMHRLRHPCVAMTDRNWDDSLHRVELVTF